ncbi:MAG: SRPBCC family protein [Gemmatimonadetes bacterium]|nr:SRPBCC family protein [Gemmatimonadota bacterium]
MTKAEFVYVTYIKTTRERLWQALTEPAFTARYWSNHHNVSDWKVGSTWEHRDAADPSILDVVGTVLESDPPRRLVFTFVSPAAVGDDDKTTRVTYDIAQAGPLVKLTVTHDRLEPGSGMLAGISTGWPEILASLKTMLETGEPLPPIRTRVGGKWSRMEFV